MKIYSNMKLVFHLCGILVTLEKGNLIKV